MTRRKWLADAQNQDDLFAICQVTIARFAPEEEPLFEEIYPKYIALAEEGEMVTGTVPEQAFSFTGDADLLILVLLPAITTLIGALLASQSASRIAELRNMRQEKIKEQVDQLAEEHLPPGLIDEPMRQWVLETMLKTPPAAQDALT